MLAGLVLAGGQGRRWENRDKGLIPFRGRPMAAYAVDRLRAVCPMVWLSCNRNQTAYLKIADAVLQDTPMAGPVSRRHHPADHLTFRGPLAGLAEALAQLAFDTPPGPVYAEARVRVSTLPKASGTLVLPCDTPLLPDDYAQRMIAGWNPGSPHSSVRMAVTAQRRHPLHLALPPRLYRALIQHHRTSTDRSMMGWLQSVTIEPVYFEDDSAFVNLNDEMALLQVLE